jgi:beta-propeller repeat-containing protein/Big-like domain-containing protein
LQGWRAKFGWQRTPRVRCSILASTSRDKYCTTVAVTKIIYNLRKSEAMMFSPTKFIPVAVLVAWALVSVAQSTPPPSWLYSTYLGGSGASTITAVTRDTDGNVYVTGTTTSPDFPTTAGVYEPTYPGPTSDNVVFVSKFSAAGSLVWSTFVGPGSFQFGVASGIQVDSDENVYVAGIFQGSGFPTTRGLPTGGSVFVVKLNAAGSQLIYGATMGPNSTDSSPQLVLDSSAAAFVSGSGPAGDCCDSTRSGVIGSLGGVDDFWVAEINAAGTALPWSVQMGGNDEDEAYGMAIDSANKLYIAGYSASINFPHTSGALDQAGTGRTFVAKLDPSKLPNGSLVYSALAGNPGHSSNDFLAAESLAVDQAGDAYVGAWTYNTGLFASQWAFQPNAPTVPNAYVFELNPSGSAIVNGTYIGGSNNDYVGKVSVDTDGNIYVAGSTESWDFLTTAYGNPTPLDSVSQAYYVKLNPQFAAVSSVAFGATGKAENYDGFATAPDGTGGLWVAGYAGSQFATTPNAYQPTYQGNGDGYLLHTNFAGLCTGDGVAICTISPDSTLPERIHFTSQASDVEDASDLALSIDGMVAYRLHAAQFDTWLPVAPGNHVATALVQDAGGEQYQDQQQFRVAASSACPLNPLTPSLTFCSPLNAAVVKGPLTIQIQANDAVPPPQVQLYVDGTLLTTLSVQNGSYTYTLQLPPGVHRVSAQGTDSGGEYVATTAIARVIQ